MTEPRWIVHADGRVSEFDRSQIAADLYRARCLQERIGAAKFAAEFTSALMHFAAKEIASPVWRKDRLKALGAEVLTELGHSETAAHWLQTFKLQTSPPSAKFSDDLIGLAEDGELQFDLNLDAPKPVFRVMDAANFIGGARSATEFVAGLRSAALKSAGEAEHVAIQRADVFAAILHRPDESPSDIARHIVALVADAASQDWTAVALDLRRTIDANALQILSGGPLFPSLLPEDAERFLAEMTKAILFETPAQDGLAANLSIWISADRLSKSGKTSMEGSHGTRLPLVIDPNHVFDAETVVAEIGLPMPSVGATDLTDYDGALLDAAMRIAVLRRDALRRLGSVGFDERCSATVHFPDRPSDAFLNAVRRRIDSLGRSYNLPLRLRLPLSDWWRPDATRFGVGSEGSNRLQIQEYDGRTLAFIAPDGG